MCGCRVYAQGIPPARGQEKTEEKLRPGGERERGLGWRRSPNLPAGKAIMNVCVYIFAGHG